MTPKALSRELEFVECDTCRAKPGSPYLCEGCLHNRAAMDTLGEVYQNRNTDIRDLLIKKTY